VTIACAVTFEYDHVPPVTWRGTVSGNQASTCASRAVRTAQASLRPTHWRSVSCTLLERLPEPEQEMGADARR
jgi:hypothetical protein